MSSPFPRRFTRQARFAPLGAEGQARLLEATVAIVGLGALGGQLAQCLCRAGVGRLYLVDRDVVDETNLPRQVLFDERHAQTATPKAEAARETLARVGGPTRLEARAEHLGPQNAERLLRGSTLVLDGTDNLPTRYLLNDWALEHAVPWIYGAVVGAEGRALLVEPGRTPCLACVFPEPPPAGALETCESAGVIGPAVGLVANLQAALALRRLARPDDPPRSRLWSVDAWSPRVASVALERDPDCFACAQGERRFLRPARERETLVLCGRNAVQVLGRAPADLERLAARLAPVARKLARNELLLRLELDEARVTLFADGRALIEGTEDEGRALAVYDRLFGA